MRATSVGPRRARATSHFSTVLLTLQQGASPPSRQLFFGAASPFGGDISRGCGVGEFCGFR
jgi:hypothetical protein